VPAGFGILARNQLSRWFAVRRRRQTDRRPDLHRGLPRSGRSSSSASSPRDPRTGRVRRPARAARHIGLSHEPHAPDSTQAIVVRPRSMADIAALDDEQACWSRPLVPDETGSLRRRLDPLRALATRRRAPRLAELPAAGTRATWLEGRGFESLQPLQKGCICRPFFGNSRVVRLRHRTMTGQSRPRLLADAVGRCSLAGDSERPAPRTSASLQRMGVDRAG
jgi:hypothetical protein